MSGTFPTSPGFKAIRTRMKHFNVSSESVNGRRQVRNLGARKRFWTLVFPPMTKAEFEPVFEFIDSQDGPYGTFSITLVDPSAPSTPETVTARLVDDIQEFEIDNASLYSFEVDIEEVT